MINLSCTLLDPVKSPLAITFSLSTAMSQISREYIITGVVVKLSCVNVNVSNSSLLVNLAFNSHDLNDSKDMMCNDCLDLDINFLNFYEGLCSYYIEEEFNKIHFRIVNLLRFRMNKLSLNIKTIKLYDIL